MVGVELWLVRVRTRLHSTDTYIKRSIGYCIRKMVTIRCINFELIRIKRNNPASCTALTSLAFENDVVVAMRNLEFYARDRLGLYEI